MKSLRKTAVAISTLLVVATGSAASDNSGNADANARLAFSDKLSMYGERIVGSACAYTSDDAPFESRGFMAVAGREIDRILFALQRGDRALGISSAEQNEALLELLSETKKLWDPVYVASQKVLGGDDSEATLVELERDHGAFSAAAARLASAISNQYTDTNSLLMSDAVRLQVAGRQRTLSQKLSAEACTIVKSGDAEARQDLSKTFKLFELSALALREGKPAAGLMATKDPELVAALDRVDRLWLELKWPLIALQTGSDWDSSTQQAMYLKLNELMHEMDKAVIAYTQAAKPVGS